MKRFSEIAAGLSLHNIQEGHVELLQGIALDSRKVAAGYLFVAKKGMRMDGHDYIDQAIEQGAKFILSERQPRTMVEGISYWIDHKISEVLPELCKRFFDDPSRKIRVIGVTGTNGKSTVVFGLYKAFSTLGAKVGMFSTFGNWWGDVKHVASLTTPDIVSLHYMLKEAIEAGSDYLFMEVSSHALDQGRVAGIDFFAAIFTNLTRDHLDYHGTMSAYRDAKKLLFDSLSPQSYGVINIDDRNGDYMVQNCRGRVLRYSAQKPAHFRFRMLETGPQMSHLSIDGHEVHSRLIGDFNAYNLAAIYGTLRCAGFDVEESLRATSVVEAPPGRLEPVSNDLGILALVDYAHTPDAVAKVLTTLKGLKGQNSKIITVIGCGGDRDRTKRPLMAQRAIEGSDLVVFTSDNPRTENPKTIIEDMIRGLRDQDDYIIQVDRHKAIAQAAQMATKGDILLVAGKGHEDYQIIGNEKIKFDDRQHLLQVLGAST